MCVLLMVATLQGRLMPPSQETCESHRARHCLELFSLLVDLAERNSLFAKQSRVDVSNKNTWDFSAYCLWWKIWLTEFMSQVNTSSSRYSSTSKLPEVCLGKSFGYQEICRWCFLHWIQWNSYADIIQATTKMIEKLRAAGRVWY